LAEGANEMLLEVPGRAENVALIRVAVAAFAGALPFTLPEIEEVKVAVSEAASNCVLHAYGADGPGRVAVRAALCDGRLTVEVRDWGRGIEDVARARQAAFTTSADPEHLGLGFTFMEQFSDELEVESTPGGGTTVRLRKRPHG
jgi:stage II sporulation protein AB (anti-sigma F factor)